MKDYLNIVPRYRVGQILKVDSCQFPYSENENALCKVIYPIEDGTYFVKVMGDKFDGYDIVDENLLIGEVELPDDFDCSLVRMVFFGNGPFALPTLQNLVSRGYDVAAVVTMPDKPSGRGRTVKSSLIKEYAVSNNIKIFQPAMLDDELFLQNLSELKPDIGVVVEFRILPECTLNVPKYGCINLHSALLPEYRGASTIPAAIRNGDKSTGVTVFKIDKNIDTGDVVNNFCININPHDNAGTIHAKLRTAGARLVDDAIRHIMLGHALIPQSEIEGDFIIASYAPKLTKADLYIPWNKNAYDVHNHIRSMTPYPGARTNLRPAFDRDATFVKIFNGKVTNIPSDKYTPGEYFIIHGGKELRIACADYFYSVTEIQPQNKKVMRIEAFLNGFRGSEHGQCKS